MNIQVKDDSANQVTEPEANLERRESEEPASGRFFYNEPRLKNVISLCVHSVQLWFLMMLIAAMILRVQS